MVGRSRVVALPPQERSTPTVAASSVDSTAATSANPAGIATSVESMGASAAHGWWGSPGAGRGTPFGSSLPGASDFCGMNPYPPSGFLSYLQNSSNFPLPREIPHQSPMPPVLAQPFIDVGSGDNEDASRTGKRLTWTQEEDLRLFSAWLNNSNDPINGNYKKTDQYWGEVIAVYNSTTPKNRRREAKQTKDRWHRVNKKVGWFCASWLKARSIYASGQSDDQLMDKAMKIYEEDYKEGQFMFMYCWKVGRDQPKWHAYIEKLDNSKKKKLSEFGEAWEDLTSAEDTKDIPHPQGTKAAKAEHKSKGKGKRKATATIEVIDDMEEKLDKFLIAQSEASKSRSDMVEVLQCMSAEKLETTKEKEAKMLDLYKGLLMHDTRGMPDDMKVEHMKALRSMREKLFGPSD